jgi:hypothetical protein
MVAAEDGSHSLVIHKFSKVRYALSAKTLLV